MVNCSFWVRVLALQIHKHGKKSDKCWFCKLCACEDQVPSPWRASEHFINILVSGKGIQLHDQQQLVWRILDGLHLESGKNTCARVEMEGHLDQNAVHRACFSALLLKKCPTPRPWFWGRQGCPGHVCLHLPALFRQQTSIGYLIHARYCALLWKCKNESHDPLPKNPTVWWASIYNRIDVHIEHSEGTKLIQTTCWGGEERGPLSKKVSSELGFKNEWELKKMRR